MTGTVATPFSAFFSPSPPRGMMRSTTPVWVASSASSSRPPPATRTIAPSGTPADSAASLAIEARTAFEWAADDEPRSTIALPDLRHRAAASIVTFGRASYTTAMTPSGTRTFRTSSPLGSRKPSMTSPTGSGSAAIERVAAATAARAGRAGAPGGPRVGERGAVEERGRQAVLAAGLHVARVRLEDLRRPGLERVRDRVQRAVLRVAVEGGEGPRRRLGGAAQVGDGLGGDGHVRKSRRWRNARPAALERRAGRSERARLGLPVALEVADQRRAVEAQRLLARVARHVPAEHVERLERHAQLTAVGDEARRPGAHELARRAFDGIVERLGRQDLVGDHPALGRVGGEVAVEEDRLTRRALADEARQAQVRGARDDALLARGQVEVRAGLGDHPVEHEQDLARAADRGGLDDAAERILT